MRWGTQLGSLALMCAMVMASAGCWDSTQPPESDEELSKDLAGAREYPLFTPLWLGEEFDDLELTGVDTIDDGPRSYWVFDYGKTECDSQPFQEEICRVPLAVGNEGVCSIPDHGPDPKKGSGDKFFRYRGATAIWFPERPTFGERPVYGNLYVVSGRAVVRIEDYRPRAFEVGAALRPVTSEEPVPELEPAEPGALAERLLCQRKRQTVAERLRQRQIENHKSP